MQEEKSPKVGVGVIVKKDGKVLMGKRKNAHATGDWCFPGGHLEFGETLEECAIRETIEEAGVTLKNIEKGPYTNDFFEKENKHYITIFMVAEYDAGEVRIMEPDKCEQWDWFDWDEMPERIMVGTINLKKTGYNPFCE